MHSLHRGVNGRVECPVSAHRQKACRPLVRAVHVRALAPLGVIAQESVALRVGSQFADYFRRRPPVFAFDRDFDDRPPGDDRPQVHRHEIRRVAKRLEEADRKQPGGPVFDLRHDLPRGLFPFDLDGFGVAREEQKLFPVALGFSRDFGQFFA